MDTKHLGVELPPELHKLLMLYAAENGLSGKGDALRVILNLSPELRALSKSMGIEYNLIIKRWGGKRDKS